MSLNSQISKALGKSTFIDSYSMKAHTTCFNNRYTWITIKLNLGNLIFKSCEMLICKNHNDNTF